VKVGFVLGSRRGQTVDHIHAADDLSEDRIVALRRCIWPKRDEELAAVGIGPALAMAITPALSNFKSLVSLLN